MLSCIGAYTQAFSLPLASSRAKNDASLRSSRPELNFGDDLITDDGMVKDQGMIPYGLYRTGKKLAAQDLGPPPIVDPSVPPATASPQMPPASSQPLQPPPNPPPPPTTKATPTTTKPPDEATPTSPSLIELVAMSEVPFLSAEAAASYLRAETKALKAAGVPAADLTTALRIVDQAAAKEAPGIWDSFSSLLKGLAKATAPPTPSPRAAPASPPVPAPSPAPATPPPGSSPLMELVAMAELPFLSAPAASQYLTKSRPVLLQAGVTESDVTAAIEIINRCGLTRSAATVASPPAAPALATNRATKPVVAPLTTPAPLTGAPLTGTVAGAVTGVVEQAVSFRLSQLSAADAATYLSSPATIATLNAAGVSEADLTKALGIIEGCIILGASSMPTSTTAATIRQVAKGESNGKGAAPSTAFTAEPPSVEEAREEAMEGLKKALAIATAGRDAGSRSALLMVERAIETAAVAGANPETLRVAREVIDKKGRNIDRAVRFW